MANLTGLTLSVASTWSNADSLYLYAEHDGSSYKVAADDLSSLLGVDIGCVLGWTGVDTSWSGGTNHRLEFNSVWYESGAGWQDLVNSPTILIAPFNGVVQVSATAAWIGADLDSQHDILLNNTFANTPVPSVRGKSTGGLRIFHSYPIPVTSGDYFTLSNWVTSTSTLSYALMSITPLRFF